MEQTKAVNYNMYNGSFQSGLKSFFIITTQQSKAQLNALHFKHGFNLGFVNTCHLLNEGLFVPRPLWHDAILPSIIFRSKLDISLAAGMFSLAHWREM